MLSFEEAEIRSSVIKALAHPVRLIIVDLLKDGEKRFWEIKKAFGADKSTISKHLSVLKAAGIVSSRRHGGDMIYRLEVPCIVDFFACVTAVIENSVRRQAMCLCKDRRG